MSSVFIAGARVLCGTRILISRTMDTMEMGIVHECHCENCGAEILYFIRDRQDEDK